MRNVLNVAFVDLRIFLASISNLVSLTVLPIALAVLLGGITDGGGGGPSRIRVDLIDQDQSERSAQFVASLRQVNETLVLCPADQDDEDSCALGDAASLDADTSRERVTEDQTSASIIIPAGYGEGLDAQEAVEIIYFTNNDPSQTDSVLTSVEAVLQRVNGAIIAARVGVAYLDALSEPLGVELFDEAARENYRQGVLNAARDEFEQPDVRVQYETTAGGVVTESSVPSGFTQSVPGIASMFVLFTVFGGMTLLLNERKQWTLQRLIVMPVRRSEILGGKILARVVLGMIQFAIVFAVGVVVGMDFGNAPLALLLVMLAFTICVTALAFAIAPQLESEAQASSLTTLLALAMAALGGAWWPLDVPFIPTFMRVIGYLTPVGWAMNGFNQVLFYNGGLLDVLLPVGVLLAASAVLFAIGIRTFRYD